MKKIYLPILIFLMSGAVSDIQGASWNYPEATQELPFEEGMGTQENPYIIVNAQQLANLAYYVNNGTRYDGAYFKLGNDIDLNPGVQFKDDFTYTSANNIQPQQWTPIGIGNGKYFAGNFDGNGHKISGLYPKVMKGEWYYNMLDGFPGASNDAYYFSGLFGVVYKSVISNLIIDNSLLMADGTTLTECFAGNAMHLGLLAGRIQDGKVINCKNNGHILTERTNYTYSGGLIGSISGDVQDCENHGNLTNREAPEETYYNANMIGGIVGLANQGTFCNMLNTGKIRNEQKIIDGYYGAANSCGGIAYQLSTEGTISNLENRGEIFNGSGIANYIEGETLSSLSNNGEVVNGSGIANSAEAHVITECSNTGSITAESSYYGSIGGIFSSVRYLGLFDSPDATHHISKCWNTGAVTHEGSNAAGLFAELDNASSYDYSNENNWVVETSFNIGRITANGAPNYATGYAAGLMIYGPEKLYDCYNAGTLTGDITYGLCNDVKELNRCFNYEQKEYRETISGEGLYVIADYVFGSYYSPDFSKIFYLSIQDHPADGTMKFGTSMTSEEFANGTVLATFKEGQQESPWFQNATDRYPKLNDIDDTVSAGVDSPVITPDDNRIYDLYGRYVGTDMNALKAGIYIMNRRKIFVR